MDKKYTCIKCGRTVYVNLHESSRAGYCLECFNDTITNTPEPQLQPEPQSYLIKFHGEVEFHGENKMDAISNFLYQAETASDNFIIDDVKKLKIN